MASLGIISGNRRSQLDLFVDTTSLSNSEPSIPEPALSERAASLSREQVPAPQASSNVNFNRVQAHAQLLKDEGQWCEPSCVAKCGSIIMSAQSDPELPALRQQNIISCFKDDCACKVPRSDPVDAEVFNKFRQDLRVEHLLLEREVQDIMSQIYQQAREDQGLDSSA
mmetsp:Transcript_16414/g.27803  ORF Transcript_16414/g.27803 Transcript_16414/m.27803 type:complete len:168 (-) Transcript_16414:698-1201(-)